MKYELVFLLRDDKSFAVRVRTTGYTAGHIGVKYEVPHPDTPDLRAWVTIPWWRIEEFRERPVVDAEEDEDGEA